MVEQPDYTKKEYRLALLEKFWLKKLKKQDFRQTELNNV